MGEFLDGVGMRWVLWGSASSSGWVEMDLKVYFATGNRGDKTQFIFFLCIKRLLKKKYRKKEDFYSK